MKDITFKQVLQYLTELREEHGYGTLIMDLIRAKMYGKETFCGAELTEYDCSFLDNLGLTYKFREDIQEWEINLIDDE